MLAKVCDSFVIYHTPFSFQHYLVATCRVAATDTTMRSELHSFAKQVASFTWQYRRLDVLWRITPVLCESPVALLEVKQALQQDQFMHSRVVGWIICLTGAHFSGCTP